MSSLCFYFSFGDLVLLVLPFMNYIWCIIFSRYIYIIIFVIKKKDVSYSLNDVATHYWMHV
jgi:hypothetical protein